MSENQAPQPKLLKDYQPPTYLIPEVWLNVDLFEDKAVVTSKLTVQRNPKASAGKEELILNGENQKLQEIHLNGKPLESSSYVVSDSTLVISNPPKEFQLEIVNEIEPQNNKALEGLYKSGDIFCTQNEPEGFRKITYFVDRPDVMAKFTTRLSAEKKKYPVLLSNGNPIDSGDLDGGRHFVTWEDPFFKPSYLFALVAGDLGLVSDEYKTKSGRTIQLKMYVDRGNESKCEYAMESLKRAMKWDEKTFGLECDLDTYMVVGVDAFNMGAMENKGLNIFNSQYILADPKTATDQNYEGIESVIGHEYFHNWTGNRVTCRDWFQITLKEGLTIFRDQEFSADMTSRAVKRISDVRVLRNHQFPEDAGPNAHPIRPQSYIEINNFYTATVYEKGSEVIRMIHTLIGRETFRKGIDKYFELYDGQAVTTDDFVYAMEQASGMDLTQFKRWYDYPGTPTCRVQMKYEEANQRVTLSVEQESASSKEVPPLFFPLSVGFVDPSGKNMISTKVLHISKPQETFEFNNISHPPIPSLLRNFSAPVHLKYDYTPEDLAFLLAHDSDKFNRYDAGQRLALILLRKLIPFFKSKRALPKTFSIGGDLAGRSSPAAAAGLSGDIKELHSRVIGAFEKLIVDDTLDPSFKAECLVLPSLTTLIEEMTVCDFEGAFEAREFLYKSLAWENEKTFSDIYRQFLNSGPYHVDSESIGRRTMKNMALSYLLSLDRDESIHLAFKQFETATNMTDEIAAFGVLIHKEVPEREKATQAFYEKWKGNTLVMNKWLAVQASSKRSKVLECVKDLEQGSVYDAKNPNKIRALVGVFSHNLVQFHDISGLGYAFLADKILECDKFNPLVAARLAEGFKKFSKLDPQRRELMGRSLERILQTKPLSGDVYEIVSKTLGPKLGVKCP